MAGRHELIGDVRGRGAMCAIELVSDRDTKEPLEPAATNAIIARCLSQGLIVLSAGTYGNVIRLLPPINIEDGLLEDGLSIIEDALSVA